MKKRFLIVLGFVLFLAGCDIAADPDRPTIGISMPTQTLERWVDDGQNMVRVLEEQGYETDLQYAEDVVENQIAQIENMITRGADLLIIAAIDGEALSGVLDQTEQLEIPVISYDRLIMNSDQISYYATFDNFQVGVEQGRYIEENLGLDEGEGPFNIELFAGAPEDNNAYFFWDGAISVLEPYIESGQLNVQSGQLDFNQAATPRWDASVAQQRMDNIMSGYYSNETVHAVYSPNDTVALGVLSSLQAAGYGSESRPYPIVTGQDAELASVRSILRGQQTQTIFKDTRLLADKAAEMTKAIIEGEEPEVNDTETYDNNEIVVPAYLIDPVSVDIDNLEEVLFESGYIDEDDI